MKIYLPGLFIPTNRLKVIYLTYMKNNSLKSYFDYSLERGINIDEIIWDEGSEK